MVPRPRFLILGNPENRRVTGFVATLRERGEPEPIVLAHRALLEQIERLAELPDEPLLVRLDATGEDGAVERLLLERGWADALGGGGETIDPDQLRARELRFGEIVAPRQRALGFLRYLRELDAVFAQRPSWRVLNPPSSVAELFDKRVTSRRYAALGVPVPEVLEGITTPEQLREAMRERGWTSVFVKLASGSSASCVAMVSLRPARGGRPGLERALTTVHVRPDGRFNSLRLQELRERETIDDLLRFLLDEGSQIERAIAKPRIAGRWFDLRVLVIAGEPVFVVVRTSPHPITNLHLGGSRGDLTGLRQWVSAQAWRRAMDSARKVHAAHGCLHVGVDLLFESDLCDHRVIEANAFGDLLPGLERGGLSVYAWEIAAVQGDPLPDLGE